MTERQARTPYERASDSYGRHINDCRSCGDYAGPPVFHCKDGRRLLDKMAEAGNWKAGKQ